MRFSKTSEYALRAMIYLAQNKGEVISVMKLHKALEIPYKYLARIMSALAEGGIVQSEPGKYGGFKLATDIKKISMADIIKITEEFEGYRECLLGLGKCVKKQPCQLHNVWVEHRERLIKLLNNTNLDDLLQPEPARIK